jgi:phosphate transport system substrate-binding protein
MGTTAGVDEQVRALGLAVKPSNGNFIIHRSQAEMIAALRADTSALGLVGLRISRAGVQTLAIRSGSQAFSPDPLTLRSEDYPLARRLHFHTGQLVTALSRGFVLYAVSPAGQSVVDRSQFVSLAMTPMQPVRNDGSGDYQKFVARARRLPIALRFSTGLDLFDSRSRQDLDRLALFLARPENSARRLVLIGFANPDPKSPYQALSLSQERVDYVASELLGLDMKVVTVRGMGGQRSLLDGNQPGSRYRNDRVEVWLR